MNHTEVTNMGINNQVSLLFYPGKARVTRILWKITTTKATRAGITNRLPWTGLLIQWLVNTPDTFVAGKISKFFPNWTTVTSDRNLLDIVCKGYLLKFESASCHLCCRNEVSFKPSVEKIIDELSNSFIEKGIVEHAVHEPREVISHVFICPKSDGSFSLDFKSNTVNMFTLKWKAFKVFYPLLKRTVSLLKLS